MSTSTTTDRVLSVLAVGLAALSSTFKIGGNDIWWHIRTGQWIWENGQIPSVDPFSHTAPGAWTYTDWLSQLIFYGLDSLGGADLLVAGKMILVGAVAAVLLKLCGRRSGPAALALCLGVMAMHMRLVLKPELFSFVFFAVLMLILARVDQGRSKRLLFFVPVVLLLWANFHRAGSIALLLLVAALIAWGIDAGRRKLVPWAAGALLVSVGALCANPAGFSYILGAFTLSTSETLKQGVAEWAPLSLSLPWLSVPYFLVMSAGWAAGWAFFRRRADFMTLVVMASMALSFRAVRFVPYAAMAMVPGLADDLGKLMDKLSARIRERVRPALVGIAMAVVGFGALGHFYLHSYSPAIRGTGAADWLLPVEVAGFIKGNPPPGKMWNSLNQGGYLLYALSPGKKVFIDGRADTVYPRSLYDETLRARHDHRVLLTQLERYRIGFAVVEYGGEEIGEPSIFRHPDWIMVYWGDRSAVMVRRAPRAGNYLSSLAFSQLRVDSALQRLANWPDDPERDALAADVLENLKRAPGSIRAHYLAALLHRGRGEQEAYLREREIVARMNVERDLQFPLP